MESRTFKAGTLVSQTTGGSIYNYALFNTKHLTLDYKCYTINYFDGTNGTAKIKTPTKFIKWVTIHNNSYTFGAKSHYSRIIIRKNENIQNITIDMNGHEPLRSVDDTRDYIDYKNKRIVRLVNSDGTIKSNPEYESITLPEIKTYDGNTIIESNDDVSPLFQAEY